MPFEARVTSIWKTQRLFAALFFLGIAAYFLWDGQIGYPRSNVRWLAHAQLEKDNRSSEWPAYAAERGWTDKVPEKFHTSGGITMQFVCAAVLGIPGLILLAYWAVQKNRILKTTDDALIEPSGKRIPFASITGLGKKDWDAKGFATVRYEMNGRRGQYVLDDYKFESEPTRHILAEIEERLLAQIPDSEQK
jgi:hypothetical protein